MIGNRIAEHVKLIQEIQSDQDLLMKVDSAAMLIQSCLENGKKLMFCGNGGSAADAQHLAAEFSGRFYLDRKPLDAEALHVNTSYLTAVGNDYDFDTIYERAVEAKGHVGDILIAMSTSGTSENILRACRKANELGITCISFTGQKLVPLHKLCMVNINVPSTNTPRIQEAHMLLGHIICERVEENIFG